MTQTLFINGTVVSPGNPDFVLENGAVLVEGARIAEVGPSAELLAGHRDARIINARGRVIMPGLINAHMHLYSTFACGLAPEPAFNFPQILKKLWWKLDRALSLDDVYYSAVFPYHRGICAGTTTMIDHHASPWAVTGSLDVLHDAARGAGVRSAFCYEVSDRDGEKSLNEGIDENIRFIEKTRSADETMAKGLFGLHASMTISERTLNRCVEATNKLGSGIHVHAAEDLSDQEDSLSKYNKRVVQRFYDAGGLHDKSILCHCIHVDDKEKELLKETGTFVVHNPESNMNNAVGAADVLGMLEMGIKVGLGTDGMTSDMLLEARTAMLKHRLVKGDPTVAFGEAVDMLVRNNAAYASKLFGVKLGVIEPGAAADLVMVEHYPFTPINVDNWYGHFLFGIQPSRVTHTMCNGQLLMAEGEVLTIDLAQAAADARKLSPQTWQRFGDMKEHTD
jgi:putative selenium metabolism protein SsnA